MRLALVHWAFPPTTGGVESHLADLARMLAERGHAVTVFTGEPEPTTDGEYEVLSIPQLELERVRRRDDRSALRRLFAAALSDRGIEVVHGHNLHHFGSGAALALDSLRGDLRLALHHTFHETWPDVLHSTPVYRGWDGNYAVSQFVRTGCAERLGFVPELLRLGVDTSRFAVPAAPLSASGVTVLLHPARLLPWKGTHTTVAATALLVSGGCDVRLLLTDTQRIADWNAELDDYRRRVYAQIVAAGLEDHVDLVSVSYAEMPRLYARADVVVYPTATEEPYGLVPLEAMSCGRPVVASRCGGIPETVLDGITGYLVPPENADALAERIERLIHRPALARELGRAGRERARGLFSLDSYVGKLERRYLRSLAITRRAGSARRTTARAR